MRRILLTAAFAVHAMAGAAGAADNSVQKAYGNWSRGDGQAKVRLSSCGKSVCAVNVWIRDPASSEKVGDRLIMKLKPAGTGIWNGTAYDPQRNLGYTMTMTLSDDRLQTKGCVLGGIVCRNVEWTRIR